MSGLWNSILSPLSPAPHKLLLLLSGVEGPTRGSTVVIGSHQFLGVVSTNPGGERERERERGLT
jgi:hypothetical protein